MFNVICIPSGCGRRSKKDRRWAGGARVQGLGAGAWQGEDLALTWCKMGKKTSASTKIPLAVVLRRLWERRGKVGQLER